MEEREMDSSSGVTMLGMMLLALSISVWKPIAWVRSMKTRRMLRSRVGNRVGVEEEEEEAEADLIVIAVEVVVVVVVVVGIGWE
jgi:hypothetical protein